MKKYHISSHSKFYAVGLSYHKADAETRGLFSLSDTALEALMKHAKILEVEGLLVINTCNRTELYGFASDEKVLLDLLCAHTTGSYEAFQQVGYMYCNYDAISHLFRVGTGLDSQILGDFEIISQLRKAFNYSKTHDLANPFLERLCNSVIQASKKIKNETGISSGATSVAFASVQYMLARVPDISNKNILLFGTGKIGRNTCENLLKHTDNSHITLINRTQDKAEEIGMKFQLIVKPIDALKSEIEHSDVLIVATGAKKPTITSDFLPKNKRLWILDLSIPMNVDPEVATIEGITLVHLDQLSQITDNTLEERKKYIPQAEKIILEVETEFKKWLETRKFAPVIKALKKKLKTMKEEELNFQSKKLSDFNADQADLISDRIIHKITRQFASHLKDLEMDSDQSLELIQKIFQLEIETP